MSWIVRNTMTKPGSDCSDFDQGRYSYKELNSMITRQGYIPVASESELVAMKTAGTKTMGAGTCWEGSYTLNVGFSENDDKFVQVRNIDFTLGGAWTTAINIGNAVYDGNDLSINNFDGEVGLLDASNAPAYCLNIHMNLNVNSTSRFIPIVDRLTGGSVINCSTSGTIVTTAFASGVCSLSDFEVIEDTLICDCSSSVDITGSSVGGICFGAINRVVPHYVITIRDCHYTGNITATTAGGIGYSVRGDINFLRCSTIGSTITCSGVYVSGILAYIRDGEINIDECVVQDCTISSSIVSTTSDQGYSAILGYKYSNILSIDSCKVINTTLSVPGGRYVGIANGRARTSTDVAVYSNIQVEGCSVVCNTIGGGLVSIINSTEEIDNCYVSCSVSGTSIGGLMQNAIAGSVVTNSYWDTTIGPATSPSGVGKTTIELQTPTSNTGIYATYDPLIWDFGTSMQFPSVIEDNSTYPCQIFNDADIIVEMGQSNMEGRFGDSPLHETANGYYWDKIIGIPLKNDRGGATLGSHATYFAETYFSLTGRVPMMVEVAKGAAGLTSTSSTVNYSASSTMRSLVEVTTASAVYKTPNANGPTAALWCQGEQDAVFMDSTPAYTPAIVKSAMQDVIDWWKSTYPGVPFVISQTGRPVSGDTTGYSNMRTIQQEIVNENSDVYMAFTNAVNFPLEGKMGDDVHYNHIGNQEMGEAFATFLNSIL